MEDPQNTQPFFDNNDQERVYTMESLLSGSFNVDTLPESNGNTVRIYLSSTMTDMEHEKRILLSNVYPAIRAYCKRNYGFEFQVVDLRFGMKEEWSEDSVNRDLYWRELTECQRLSTGPSFLALLGQRYGHQPLPGAILEEDFHLIYDALTTDKTRSTRMVELLDRWYQKDTNVNPAVFRLNVPKTEAEVVERNRNVSPFQDERKQPQTWNSTREEIQNLIKRGIDLCIEHGHISEIDRMQYLMSDLERELQLGIVHHPNPQNSCIVVSRNIVDLKNYVHRPDTDDYVEKSMDEMNDIIIADREKQENLSNLLNKKLPSWLPSENISNFEVLWRFKHGIDEAKHIEYLSGFCETLYEQITSMIDVEAANTPSLDGMPRIHEELFQHWIICRNKCQMTCNGINGNVLEAIQQYLLSTKSKPLVVCGPYGSGKSTAISITATQIGDWLPEESFTILRYLGSTIASSDIRLTLQSLCEQLFHLLGEQLPVLPNSVQKLSIILRDVLWRFPSDKTVVILLDGLQEIEDKHCKVSYDWLPNDLRQNVKIIVTVNKEAKSITEKLQEHFGYKDEFIELKEMSLSESQFLFDDWLTRQGRSLTESQKVIVKRAMANCPWPLYVRLLFNDARTWTSYHPIRSIDIPLNARLYTNHFFDNLEKQHGKRLVSRVSAYLTAAATGLSDSEIEDILSLDEIVMSDVNGEQDTPESRIPPVRWILLKYDMDAFIMQRISEGVTVNVWSHSLFTLVARDRYINNPIMEGDVHRVLAEYFMGTWAGKQKPRLNINQRADSEQATDRLVPFMPLAYRSEDGIERYNSRIFEPIPHHLQHCGSIDEYKEKLLFSFEWILMKAKAFSLDHVLWDFSKVRGVETGLVEKALRESLPIVSKNIQNLCPELTGRLLPYYQTHSNIKRLIDDCDHAVVGNNIFLPDIPYHQLPGRALKHSLQFKFNPNSFAFLGNEYIFAKSSNGLMINVFDVQTGKLSGEFCTSKGTLHIPNGEQCIVVIDKEIEKSIKIHSIADGAFLGHLIPATQVKLKNIQKYEMNRVSLSDKHIAVVITCESSYLMIADIDRRKFVDVRGLGGRNHVCEITKNSEYVFCNSGNTLLTFRFQNDQMNKISSTRLECIPRQMALRADGSRGFLTDGKENKIHVMHFSEGSLELIYKIVIPKYFQDSVKKISLSNNQEILLACGHDSIIVYHVHTERVVCHIKRPDDLPKEFKLPKDRYRNIHLENAQFSSDSKFILASLLRTVFIWHSSTGRLLTSLQAPIGNVAALLMSPCSSTVVTNIAGMNEIQIWGLGDAINQIQPIDKLTRKITDIQITSNQKMAFVKCEDSDEIGVVDLESGQLLDLLTHDNAVQSYSPSNNGKFLFVATTSKSNSNIANKIWNVWERKVIHEFGDVPAYNISLTNESTFISVMQMNSEYNSPYGISLYKCQSIEHDEFTPWVKFVLSDPFITPEDRYIVLQSADSYDSKNGCYVNPTICAVSPKSDLSTVTYSARDLQSQVRIQRILHIRPMPTNSYTIMVFFTSEPDIVEDHDERKNIGYDHCYCFMVFDICSGMICQIIDDLIAPRTPLDQILFNADVSLCIDNESNIFDMGTGYFLHTISQMKTRPQCLAHWSRIVLYISGEELIAIRLQDGVELGRVNTHSQITCLRMCPDDRTVVVGCSDGSFLSYTIVDETGKEREDIISRISSRKPSQAPQNLKDERSSAVQSAPTRLWDRVQKDVPAYSRPASSIFSGPTDRNILRDIKSVYHPRPRSEISHLINSQSKTCSIM